MSGKCIKSKLSCNKRGYPQKMTCLNGRRKIILLHRKSLEEKIGRAIKKGFYACHSCGNRWCVNADHIYEGTPKQNHDDMIMHGTLAVGKKVSNPGTKHPSAKLTEENVVNILISLRNGVSGALLARKYGVTKQKIWQIKNNKNWKHINRDTLLWA
jgi:hypothetical protein